MAFLNIAGDYPGQDRLLCLAKVLASDTRLAILRYLHRYGQAGTPAFRRALSLSQPCIHEHLALLEAAGLVVRVAGSDRDLLYEINHAGFAELAAALNTEGS